MKNTIESVLDQALLANGLVVAAKARQQLLHYLDLLQTWNQVFNLTSITTPREMVYLHLIDSLSVNPYLEGNRLLDVGSGAGLPGIPLAILNPKQQWVLLDKNNKKTRFQTQVIAELGLANVQAVHRRSEDFHPGECFDSILSRAFGTIGMFVETTQHLLCPHGVFIAMKGKYPEEELAELTDSVVVKQITRLNIKGIDVERHIACLTRKD